MFSTEQIMFTLAWAAYHGDPLPFGPGADAPLVQRSIEHQLHTLPPLGDAWGLAWGPALHQSGGAIFDDAMIFVAQSRADPGRLVIAIRGTNPISLSSWLFQDFFVHETAAWPYGSPDGDPLISEGTRRGLSTLLGLVPAPGVPGEGVRLLDFLRARTSGGGEVDLTVTGHSLGGVLASTLALALLDLQADWDPGRRARLTTYSFAAPTAGNRDFAAYTDARIGATLHRVWNSLDVVPHAWNAAALDEVPALYLPDCLPDPLFAGACLAAERTAAPLGYAHPEAGNEGFTGTISPAWPIAGAQVVYQHAQAYLNHLHLDGVLFVTDVLSALQAAQLQARGAR